MSIFLAVYFCFRVMRLPYLHILPVLIYMLHLSWFPSVFLSFLSPSLTVFILLRFLFFNPQHLPFLPLLRVVLPYSIMFLQFKLPVISSSPVLSPLCLLSFLRIFSFFSSTFLLFPSILPIIIRIQFSSIPSIDFLLHTLLHYPRMTRKQHFFSILFVYFHTCSISLSSILSLYFFFHYSLSFITLEWLDSNIFLLFLSSLCLFSHSTITFIPCIHSLFIFPLPQILFHNQEGSNSSAVLLQFFGGVRREEWY